MTDPIRIVLADDERLVRAGLAAILGSEPGFEVVGEAADGLEALDAVQWRRPDIVLMDVRMPRMDGLEATRRLVGIGEGAPRVVILTTFALAEYVFEALRAGASGFLLKNAPPEDLIDGIRLVMDGGGLLAPEVTGRVMASFAVRPSHQLDAHRLDRLTEREREILGLVGRGMTNAEIADRLVIGEATVKTHVSSILGKLEVRDRVGAVIVAYETGLIDPGDGMS